MILVSTSFCVSIICFVSLFGVTLYRKQFLMILLSFEITALSIFIMMYSLFLLYGHPLSMALYMLIIVVCEASLGLSLLVMLTRAKGNDNLLIVGLY